MKGDVSGATIKNLQFFWSSDWAILKLQHHWLITVKSVAHMNALKKQNDNYKNYCSYDNDEDNCVFGDGGLWLISIPDNSCTPVMINTNPQASIKCEDKSEPGLHCAFSHRSSCPIVAMTTLIFACQSESRTCQTEWASTSTPKTACLFMWWDSKCNLLSITTFSLWLFINTLMLIKLISMKNCN